MLLRETARVRSGRAFVPNAAASGVCGENSDYILLFTFYACQRADAKRVDQASLARQKRPRNHQHRLINERANRCGAGSFSFYKRSHRGRVKETMGRGSGQTRQILEPRAPPQGRCTQRGSGSFARPMAVGSQNNGPDCLPRHALPLGHRRHLLVFSRRHQLNETRSAVAQCALDGRSEFVWSMDVQRNERSRPIKRPIQAAGIGQGLAEQVRFGRYRDRRNSRARGRTRR